MTFGQHLIELRKQHDVGRKRLHELSGLSLSYLHYIENDQVLPGPDNLRKIAKAIEEASRTPVSAEELIRERDRVELERMGFDANKAHLTLLLKERGPLDDSARATIEKAIDKVLSDPRSRGS